MAAATNLQTRRLATLGKQFLSQIRSPHQPLILLRSLYFLSHPFFCCFGWIICSVSMVVNRDRSSSEQFDRVWNCWWFFVRTRYSDIRSICGWFSLVDLLKSCFWCVLLLIKWFRTGIVKQWCLSFYSFILHSFPYLCACIYWIIWNWWIVYPLVIFFIFHWFTQTLYKH